MTLASNCSKQRCIYYYIWCLLVVVLLLMFCVGSSASFFHLPLKRNLIHGRRLFLSTSYLPICKSSLLSVERTRFRLPHRSLSRGKGKNVVWKHDYPLLPLFFRYVKEHDFQNARETFEAMMASHSNMLENRNIFSAMLSVCEKSDHYDYACKVRDELKKNGYPCTESDVLPLVKCACDKGDLLLARQHYQEIIQEGLFLRHRDIQPILHLLATNTDIKSSYEALHECFRLSENGLYPRPEELSYVIESSVRTGAICEVQFKRKLSDLISQVSATYCSIDHFSACRILLALQSTCDNSSKLGILVKNEEDISGQILTDEPIFEGAYVAKRLLPWGLSDKTAENENDQLQESAEKHNASLASLWVNELPNVSDVLEKTGVPSSSIDVYDVISHEKATIRKGNKTYVGDQGIQNVITEYYNTAIKICPVDNQSSAPPSGIKYFLKVPQADQPSSNSSKGQLTEQNCRLIEANHHNATCPNCGDKLEPIHMNLEDIQQIKEELIKTTSSVSISAGKKLKQFKTWLAQQEDFDYVMDAANVAYHNQNFNGGKFSFQQVELMYEAIKRSSKIKNPRVLVMIPEMYLKRNRYNSAGNRMRTKRSADDSRIIAKLKDEKSFYSVPQHINDDWFVIYATLCGKRYNDSDSTKVTPIYAVSNDFSRDHKQTVLSPRPFFRWKSTHVVFFDFKRAITEENAGKKQNIVLNYPCYSSREFQRSENNSNRWHIPLDDRLSWICLNV